MNVKSFAEALLGTLTDTGLFEQVALQTEGPVVHGMAYVRRGSFCASISELMRRRCKRLWRTHSLSY